LNMTDFLGKIHILYRWLFTNQPTTAAIDLTHRCNLKCAHCYWWKQEHPEELDDAAMVGLMRSLRRRGLRAAILYGGEPTLRLGMCRAACRIFDATLAFTNGTNGFPLLPNGQWILSLDGPEEVNDRIRGRGVYARAVENLYRAPQPPIVHITISQANRSALGAFVAAMMDLPVKGVGFSFYTPSRGEAEDPLFIPLHERDALVGELTALRDRYGEKVGFTRAMARQFLSRQAFQQWNSLDTCPVAARVRCFRSDGSPKVCTYGEEADCSRCGCAAVAAYRAAFHPPDRETLRVILGLMIPRARPGQTLLRALAGRPASPQA